MTSNRILRRLRRDESGQAIVFAAITMLFVVIAVMMVFQTGLLVDRRIQAQNAADAAAYSGAATKAACVNSIEWLNEGMAYLYRWMLWYAYDEMYFSGASFTGEPQDIANFAATRAHSPEWIERGMKWMQRIGQMEEGIANAMPRLVEEEVRRVAALNGAQAVTLWPNYPEYETFVSRTDHLNCVFEPRDGGWFIASNTDHVLLVERPFPGYFTFNLHDNNYAHNGVRTQNAVGMRVSGTHYDLSFSGINIRVNGNTIRFYDGTTYIMSITLPPNDPGQPPEDELAVDYGDGSGNETVSMQALQNAGANGLTLSHTYVYAEYRIDVAWSLIFTGRAGQTQVIATLDTVTVQYGNTFVQSTPSDTYIRDEFGNGAMSASYIIEGDGPPCVYGNGFLQQIGPRWVYAENRLIGGSQSPPAFVEDTMTRFLARVNSAQGSMALIPIDAAFGRTRYSDWGEPRDFLMSIIRHSLQGPQWERIIQSQTWQKYAAGENDYQAIDLARIPMPLSVTEECFRYGVNVGVWMPQEDTIPFFHNPPHGFFAVASAALGKGGAPADLTPPDDSLLVVNLPDRSEAFYAPAGYSYVKTFDSAADRWNGVNVSVNVSGPRNYWEPVLVPVKQAILREDIDRAGFALSSAELVYEMLVGARWFDPATGLENGRVPQMLADIRKPEYEAMMRLEMGDEYYNVREWHSPPFEYSGREFDDSVQH